MKKPAFLGGRGKVATLGITSIALVALAAGTMVSMALFTDDADVDNNDFSTGTIVLTTNPTSALFSVPAMMPGDDVYGQLTVSNGGTGDLRYSMTSSSTNDAKNLGGVVTLEVREKAAGTCASNFTGNSVMASTVLNSAAFGDSGAGQDTGDRPLAFGASEVLCFKASLDSGTDDSYQDADTTTTFTFEAEQTAHNP